MQRINSGDDSAAYQPSPGGAADEPPAVPRDAEGAELSPAAGGWCARELAFRGCVYGVIAASGAIADLWTKAAVFRWRGLPGEQQQPPWWLVEDLVGVETAVNIGAVFGIGAGKGTLFAALSVVAGIGILVWLFWYGAARSWWLLVALAMVSGGIVGNLYDRLGMWWEPGMREEWRSGVRDWILMQAGDAYKWPNYNIADSLLVIGAGMLVWRSFFPSPEHAQSHEPTASSS